MKKTLKLALYTGLVASAALLFEARAAVYQTLSFWTYNSTTPLKSIADLGYQLAINTAYTNGTTNTVYYLYGNNYPQFVSASQPLFAYSTNQIGITSGGTIGGTGYTNITAWNTNLYLLNPLAFSLTGTNTFFIVYTNGNTVASSGATLPGLFSGPQVPGWADANGQQVPPSGITFAADTDGYQEVGNLTIYLEKTYDGLTWNTNDLYTLLLKLNGTNLVVTNFVPPLSSSYLTNSLESTNATNFVASSAITNFPSWFNAKAYQIWGVTTPTNSTGAGAATNVYLFTGELSGFIP